MTHRVINNLMVAAAAIGWIAPGWAQTAPTGNAERQPTSVVAVPEVQTRAPLKVPMGKSQVLRVNQAVGKIAVGNPAILDAVALTDRSLYVLGKTAGTTNVSIYNQRSQLVAVIDVTVGIDVQGVKSALYDSMPNERIEVRSVNDTIALAGVVSSPAKVNEAMTIAGKFVPEKSTVINNLSVHGAQQVMLEVKVAEMQRSITRDLGFKPFLQAGNANSSNFTFTTLDTTDLTRFAVAAGNFVNGNFTLNLLMDALEQKGAVKILAEPNLVALSGDTANFLAGGEFPIPVAQTTGGSSPTITVEFKSFGVSLAFTPTVVDKDLINLAVAPEVSQIDKQNAVVINNGFLIPGISTRRARTTIELRDGQSFAIAGLLQSDLTDQVRQIPGLGDLPIIGALLRDSQFQRHETELVIIVTPRLVQPAPEGTLLAPTDSFVPPSEVDMFWRGQTEGAGSGIAPESMGGGLTGRYGHIIR